MTKREQEIKDKWGPIKSRPDEDLKQIAKDLYNNKIYTDRHCGSDVMSHFMILMFMGPQAPSKPKHPNEEKSIENDRDNALYDVLEREKDQEKYEEEVKWNELACQYYDNEYVPSIGLVYEYMTQAGPMSVNGGPVFMSMRLLNKVDTEKMFEYYEKYKTLREEVDSF